MSHETFMAAIQQEEKIEDLRLQNWRYWSKGGYPDFSPAEWCEIWNGYIKDDHVTRAVTEADAQHIEDCITELYLQYLHNKDDKPFGARNWGEVWFTVLKIKYLERDRPERAMAEELRRRLKRRCAGSTFRKHAHEAKKAVFTVATSI